MRRYRTAPLRVGWGMLLCCLLASLPGLGQSRASGNAALARPVRPTPGTRQLGAVLAELSRQSRVPFSYSSSLIPTARQCHLRPGTARPLAVVLREVLAAAHLSFGLVGGQLVLWPEQAGIPAGVTAVNGRLGTAGQPTASPSNSFSFGSAENKRVPPRRTLPAAAVAGATAAAGNVSSIVKRTMMRQPLGVAANPRFAPHSHLGFSAAQKRGAAVNRAASAGPASNPAVGAGFKLRNAPHSASGPVTTMHRPSRSNPARWALAVSKLSVVQTRSMVVKWSGAASFAASGKASVVFKRNQTTALKRPMPDAAAAATESQAAASPSIATLPPTAFDSTAAPQAAATPVSPLVSAPLKPVAAADSGRQRPAISAGLLGPRYLHGEASTGETLLVSGVAKGGFQRAYLLLGAAVADHQGSWGLGLGTAGRARGRFTPSLDVLYWWLSGPRNDRGPSGSLMQLRPLLAWQLKAGSRWQLVGGPTLTLATTPREGTPGRGLPGPSQLGQGQWLWLSIENSRDNIRLWPGLQVGLRF